VDGSAEALFQRGLRDDIPGAAVRPRTEMDSDAVLPGVEDWWYRPVLPVNDINSCPARSETMASTKSQKDDRHVQTL
jgi:hypothetical protein